MNIGNFFGDGGEFEGRYAKLDQRFETMRFVLAYFFRLGGKVIVETGCQREKDDWGAGCSTSVFSECIQTLDSEVRLWTVDISQQAMDVCKICTMNTFPYIDYVLDDSVEFLKRFDKPIDLLYLDSYDWLPEEPILSACQQHQLKEIHAAWKNVHPKTVILLDDNGLDGGGKTKATRKFLKENDWEEIFNEYQSAWIHKDSEALKNLWI